MMQIVSGLVRVSYVLAHNSLYVESVSFQFCRLRGISPFGACMESGLLSTLLPLKFHIIKLLKQRLSLVCSTT